MPSGVFSRSVFRLVNFFKTRRIPPFDPGSVPAERDARRRFDFPDPVSKIRCVVNDEGDAVFGEDVLKKSVEKYIPIYFLKRFTIIPGRGPNETVIRALIAPVEEMVLELILQST